MLQQENPALRGKPVGVLKSAGRTCIIAASKEAKVLGVKTGCRLKDAKILAPHIITVPAEFDLCLHATKQMIALFNDISPDVEVFSLDEAFINLETCQKYMYPDPLQLSEVIQQRVKQELGEWVTCNIGIAKNRLLAKMASEVGAKGSISVVTDENKDALLASTTFDSVCGIGTRLGAKLESMGANTPYLIRFLDDEQLLASVGPYWRKELRKISYGEESDQLKRLEIYQPMKSVGRSITGYALSESEDEIKRVLYNLIEEAMYKVRKMKLAGRYVAVGLSGSNFEHSWHTHRTLQYYINHTNEMYDIISKQLLPTWKNRFPVIKFWIRLAMLKPASEVVTSLLPSWQKQEKISTAIDHITQKYGLFTVTNGLMYDKKKIITPEVTGYLGDKEYQLEVR